MGFPLANTRLIITRLDGDAMRIRRKGDTTGFRRLGFFRHDTEINYPFSTPWF
jgi:hypothetical protein